jgi:hypothetical protein
MQNKETNINPFRRLSVLFVPLFLILVSAETKSQTTFIPQGDKQYILLERMEIKGIHDSLLRFSKNRPFSRKIVAQWADKSSETINQKLNASNVDHYNMESMLMNNGEWLQKGRILGKSKKPVLNSFYRTKPNLYEVHIKDFDLIINPVIQFVVSKEKDNDQKLFLNTRGLTLRGKIANKIGFYTYLTDNQERDPAYVQQWVNERQAVPGQGYYKSFKSTGYDYFEARGYFTFNVTKYIDVAFGYDKNFIGNGHRSLFLSDFSNNTLFLKLNTRIWKLNYQNLFMELHPSEPRGPDRLLKKKYAVMHHLDMNITKSVNIGLFEGVIFGRPDHFEFGYLNPVIFYRSIEQQNGSFDNAVAGLDVKANIKRSVQLYGQLLLDEFLLSEIKKNRGWWANKWGMQFGAKYIDAFGIKNLDLQLEHNRVRPFTYSHNDSVANYTHYNQPLAHPLGANFSETIGILRYQPAPKWLVVAKAMYYMQGRDSNTVSYGSNIFLPNTPPYRGMDYGYNIGNGWKTNVTYLSLLLSYELRENLFIEANAVIRRLETKTTPLITQNTSIFSIGFRWNMYRREFDF